MAMTTRYCICLILLLRSFGSAAQISYHDDDSIAVSLVSDIPLIKGRMSSELYKREHYRNWTPLHTFVTIYQRPSAEHNYYWIKVVDSGFRWASILYDFFVYPANREVKQYDTTLGIAYPLCYALGRPLISLENRIADSISLLPGYQRLLRSLSSPRRTYTIVTERQPDKSFRYYVMSIRLARCDDARNIVAGSLSPEPIYLLQIDPATFEIWYIEEDPHKLLPIDDWRK